MRKQMVWKKKRKVSMLENEKMKPMRVKNKMEMGNNKQ
jgi:hypothetical protein